ncbi:hypothetical protein HID58_009668 [Brassica napus]|uniref:Uncharacterized protein n=1 Tax=Brassica napus TaxID=3708 RepID=A0ABQ8DT46_BRANA|nr:hypothetical protein HID58_009668 [Brassica napus]
MDIKILLDRRDAVFHKNMHGGGETTATATEARGLKKGPWTTTEDAILTEYVRKHGEGNWNALPGRTDNEIKNFWNTRMKRRQRAGLPLYPHEIHHQGIDIDDDSQTKTILITQNMIQYTNSSNTPSPSSSFSSSSSQPQKNMCLDPLIYTNPSLNHIPETPMNTHMFSLYNNSLENENNQFGFSLPLSSSSSSNEFCTKKDTDAMSYSSFLMRDHEMRPSSFPLGLDNAVLELPSVQTTTHFCSYNTIIDNGVHLYPPAGNSGLLDTVLEESRALSRGGIFKDVTVSSSSLCEDQDKRVEIDFENRLIDHLNSSHQSSSETTPNLYKRYNEPTIVKTTMDDDDGILLSFINNFPSTTPLRDDWYRVTEIQTEALTSGILIGNHQGNSKLEPQKAPPSSGTVDPLALLGSCY